MARLFVFPDSEHPYAANIYRDYESGTAEDLEKQLDDLAADMMSSQKVVENKTFKE